MNERNAFNALINVPQWVTALMQEAEHNGAWTTGIESDRKQRGTAINCDCYGYDESQGLAVVQVRQAIFNPKRFTRVRKDYYLIGHNENGSFFSHPVETPARSRKALETPESCVSYVLAKIWDCRPHELKDIERQGDVAFIPVYRIPDEASPIEGPVTINETHVLTGDIWRHGGLYYTRRGARLTHSKRQHASVKAKAGYYRVQPGARASNWGFTAPLGD